MIRGGDTSCSWCREPCSPPEKCLTPSKEFPGGVEVRGGEEVGRRRGGSRNLGRVEHPLGQPAKKPRHAVFQHIAPRTQQGRARGQLPAEQQQIVLVAAGAMQQEEGRRRWIAGGFEAVV